MKTKEFKESDQLEMFDYGPREQVNFRIPKPMWEALKARAKDQDVTASVILRRLVRQYLADSMQLELVSSKKQKESR